MADPVKPADKKPFLSVNLTPAMSGYFVTLYDWSWMESGANIHGDTYATHWYAEPYDTGMGRYPTWEQANAEGERWAAETGYEFFPATAERVAKAEARSARFRQKTERCRQLRESGMGFREAWRQAREEFPDPE